VTSALLCKDDAAFFRRHIRKWFSHHRRDLPWRATKDGYLILLAESLLQQTDVKKALGAYSQLCVEYPRAKELAEARQESLEEVFKQIGLRYRAKRLRACAQAIVQEWGGRIPADPMVLQELPGVGRYIAYAVCAAAFGKRLALVDTNVARVLRRFFGFRGNKKRARDDPEVWRAAKQLMSLREPRPAEWNWSVLDFAALICRSHEPLCHECPVSARCVHLLGS